MKQTTFQYLLLASICWMAVPGLAEQFIDCSEGDEACDVLYASDDIFVADSSANEAADTGIMKTNDMPLAQSKPLQEVLGTPVQVPAPPAAVSAPVSSVAASVSVSDSVAEPDVESVDETISEEVQEESTPQKTLPVAESVPYEVVLPQGATQISSPDNPQQGTVVVPSKKVDSRVDVMPDGSVKTTSIEIVTESLPDAQGYQETTRRIERTDTEKKGAVWVEKTLTDKINFGDGVHDWEAARGETLRSLLMQWGEVSGWTVVWKLDKDYKLEAGVVFRGTFTEVASAIIRTFARAVPAPIGTFYKGNRVLVVSIQEDENAH